MALVPMLLVKDVEASSKWLRQVLPLESAHGGPDFEMLADDTGEVVAWLHAVETAHEHLQFKDIDANKVTGGAIFYFKVADIDEIFAKAEAANARILEKRHFNPLARFSEFTFEDPNGYRFAVHTAFGSAKAS